MLELDTHMLLKHYLAQGLSQTAIARQLGISDRTIRRWIAHGELERDLSQPPRYRPRPPQATKLDPYKALIEARLAAYPKLSAVRLFEEVQAGGYPGSYSQVRDFVRQVRPRPVQGPILRFETPAGHQGQVDFAEFSFPFGKRYALLVVLGYSRLLWLDFYRRQDMATLFRGLEQAFAFFGGVPRELLFDQMKAVITADLRLLGGQVVVNEEFLRFAAHWGFRPRACRPYRAQTKGKVERPIRYVRENFIYGRDFCSDGDLAEQSRRWMEKANARRHATTKEVPGVRFERDERALLLPPAERPYRSLIVRPLPDVDTRATLGTIGRLPHAGDDAIRVPAMPRVHVEKRALSVYAEVADSSAPAGARR